jgi:anti-sigma regulatory factor (Ser/Thr protein kinase)
VNYVMLGLDGRAGWTLPGEPRSVRAARELARAVAAGDEDQAETAALCVSELVTNALVHSRSGLLGGTVMVCFEALPASGALFIAVQDDGTQLAAGPGDGSGLPGPAESGYGLGIVAAVTSDWGVVPRGDGRSATWCIVPATGPAANPRPAADPLDLLDAIGDGAIVPEVTR